MMRGMNWSAIPLVIFFAVASLRAQQPPTAAQAPYGVRDAKPRPRTIHVDENCRILPTAGDEVLRKKEHPYRDSALCDIESPNDSTHWEERIAGNQLLRTFVRVKEQEFALRNIADEPVMFVVSQKIPKDWAIDSDPQPVDLVGQTAYFDVYVKPGETIRLHVGLRRDWPQKPKPL